MTVYNTMFPYVVMWFALLDATILVVVGSYIGIDFIWGDDQKLDSAMARFMPAAFFFAGFNILAVLILAAAHALLRGA